MNNISYISALQKLKKLNYSDNEILDIFCTVAQSALVKTLKETNSAETDLKTLQTNPDSKKRFHLIFEENLKQFIEETFR